MPPRTISLDFDGVLHRYDGKWQDQITGHMIPGALVAILSYFEAGFQVCIHSTRNRTHQGRWAMANWLIFRGLPEYLVNLPDLDPPGIQGHELWGNKTGKLRFPVTKPPAWVYLDDRGWPSWDYGLRFPTVEELQSFRPWHQKAKKPRKLPLLYPAVWEE